MSAPGKLKTTAEAAAIETATKAQTSDLETAAKAQDPKASRKRAIKSE